MEAAKRQGSPISVRDLELLNGEKSGPLIDRHDVFTAPAERKITRLGDRKCLVTDGLVSRCWHRHGGNDVAAGGFSMFLHSRKHKSYDIWLLGPLSFLDRAYGSLIIELSGYESRKIFSRRDSWDKMTYWTEFPKGALGHFHHCKLLQTGFHLQAGASDSSIDMETIKEKREAAIPVHIASPFVRVDWTVVSQIASQTDCALYEQEGL